MGRKLTLHGVQEKSLERTFNRPANRMTEEVTFQMPSAIEKLSAYIDKKYKISIKDQVQ